MFRWESWKSWITWNDSPLERLVKILWWPFLERKLLSPSCHLLYLTASNDLSQLWSVSPMRIYISRPTFQSALSWTFSWLVVFRAVIFITENYIILLVLTDVFVFIGLYIDIKCDNPDSKVHGDNMGPTWVLSAPDGPHGGPMNLAIRDYLCGLSRESCWKAYTSVQALMVYLYSLNFGMNVMKFSPLESTLWVRTHLQLK